MNSLQEITARRGRLLERAQNERETIARSLVPLEGAISVMDRVWRGATWLRTRLHEQPMATAAALGLALVLRPRRALRWLRLGMGAWQTWRLVAGALRAAAKQG